MCIVTFITSVVAFRNGTKLTEDSIMQENKEDSELSTDEDIKGSPSVDADTEKKKILIQKYKRILLWKHQLLIILPIMLE